MRSLDINDIFQELYNMIHVTKHLSVPKSDKKTVKEVHVMKLISMVEILEFDHLSLKILIHPSLRYRIRFVIL